MARGSLIKTGGILLLSMVVWGATQTASAAELPLSPEHKRWLEEDVVYIISKDEREAFLNLTSRLERERFIEQFWALRDPTPGTPENEFKEEHYRRIQHANMYFSRGSGKEGWRTDRGRIYIQLGPPAQRVQYPWLGEARPMELWFYFQGEHPSLPNAFNILFYQPEDIGEYRLYSPYMDGPPKLVKRTGTENDPAAAYRYLRTINLELARSSLTLLTDEPVDPDNPSPSLASDAMLVRIRNLPNDRFEKEKLARRAQLRELVETRIFLEPGELEVVWVPFRHGEETFVHFLLVLPRNLEELASEDKDKKQYLLSTQVSVLVRTQDGREVYQQDHEQVFTFAPEQFERQAKLPVAYADRLPLAPGDYEVDFVLREKGGQQYFSAHQALRVPGPGPSVAMGPLLAYEGTERALQGQPEFPFQLAGFRFNPSSRSQFGRSEELSVLFQVYLPHNAMLPERKLQVDYTLGSLAGAGPRQTFSEEIDTKDFDAHGVVLHGKRFPLGELASGHYRLAAKVTDPQTMRSAAQTLDFRVLAGSPESKRVTLFDQQFPQDEKKGWVDYRYGACYAALGEDQKALEWLQGALRKNPKLTRARTELAQIYFRQQRHEDVAKVLESAQPEELTEETVVLQLASLEQLGRFDEALGIGERALVALGPSETLYDKLGSLYERLGRAARAQEARQEARRLREGKANKK